MVSIGGSSWSTSLVVNGIVFFLLRDEKKNRRETHSGVSSAVLPIAANAVCSNAAD